MILLVFSAFTFVDYIVILHLHCNVLFTLNFWIVSVEEISHVTSASIYTLSSDIATWSEAKENCEAIGQKECYFIVSNGTKLFKIKIRKIFNTFYYIKNSNHFMCKKDNYLSK